MASRFIFLLLGLALFAGQAAEKRRKEPKTAATPTDSKALQAVAVIHPTLTHGCSGVVEFFQAGPRVRIRAEVQGLAPRQLHAINICEFGDCSAADASSAGGHFNPEGKPHGSVMAKDRHAGDLGNLLADNQGKARYDITVESISLSPGRNSVLGRSIVIHAMADDGKGETGNAGLRIGCGVIGISAATNMLAPRTNLPAKPVIAPSIFEPRPKVEPGQSSKSGAQAEPGRKAR